MISYGRHSINKADVKAVLETLKSDWLTQGPKILEFEKNLARYSNAKYAVVCVNGSSALHLAYLAAGLKNGDEIITSPNTFAATTNMMLVVGAKPVFCDIRLETNNIDERKIEKLVTKKTKAIVPVHFAGHPCQMDRIKQIAKKHKLIIVEDACHALGAKYKNNKIGSCKYSDMAVFSFHPVKSITTGEGGAILTNSTRYYKKLILLRNHGIRKDKKGKNVMTELGFNYRLTDIQCALGISQLKRLDKFIEKRHKVVSWYTKELKDIKHIILPQELSDCCSSWHLYIIRVKNSKIREQLKSYLLKNNIGVNFHYPAIYKHPYYQKIDCLPRTKAGQNIKLQNMEKYYNSCITLPCHTLITRKDIKYIGKIIKKFFNSLSI